MKKVGSQVHVEKKIIYEVHASKTERTHKNPQDIISSVFNASHIKHVHIVPPCVLPACPIAFSAFFALQISELKIGSIVMQAWSGRTTRPASEDLTPQRESYCTGPRINTRTTNLDILKRTTRL